MKAGYEAQLRSVVLLKNSHKTLPLQKQLKAYIPKKLIPASKNWFGVATPEIWKDAVNPEIAKKYFVLTDKPEEADFALVCIDSPKSGVGYDQEDLKMKGNGYVPISLQYGPYKAEFARDQSIAGGSPFEKFTNRSYKGKTMQSSNIQDMKTVLETKAKMKGKPVVMVVKIANPMVFSEIEKEASAILIHMGVQDQALMEILTGRFEPSALLPFQMPANMKTVEEQQEDMPFDMNCYKDSEGNSYDFAFGLNWGGVIQDARVTKYKKALSENKF